MDGGNNIAPVTKMETKKIDKPYKKKACSLPYRKKEEVKRHDF